MKPASFDYLVARSVEEAVAALAAYGDDAVVLAGGQSLVPLLNMRLARPALVVDVNRIAGLAGIAANGVTTIGALTRQAAALRSPELAERAPLLVAALGHVGHVATRSRGTVGGSAATPTLRRSFRRRCSPSTRRLCSRGRTGSASPPPTSSRGRSRRPALPPSC